MLYKLNLDNILFLDIETVPEFEHFDQLSEEKKVYFRINCVLRRKRKFFFLRFRKMRKILESEKSRRQNVAPFFQS